MKEGLTARRLALLLAAIVCAVLVSTGQTVSAASPVAARPPVPGPSEPPISKLPGLSHSPRASISPRAAGLLSSWYWQNPKPDGNPLQAISCASATVCYAVGFAGPIIKTADGGATWAQQANVPGLYAVSCGDVTHCVAVGNNGVVVVTSDGTTWTSSTITGALFLDGVSCLSSSTCYTVDVTGLVEKTTNLGGSWSTQNSGLANLLAVSCFDTNHCMAVGYVGAAIYTTDGTNWYVSSGSTGTGNNLYGVSCSSTVACEAVGQFGTIVTTANFGTSWFPSTTGSQATLTSVSCANGCFAAGVDGAVYYGITSHGSTGATGSLWGISCLVATCFAAGDYETIVETTTGGTAWSFLGGIGVDSPYGIACPSTTVCYVVGFAGQIAATTNGGTTWTNPMSGTTQSLNAISCTSTTACFAVGSGGAIAKTTDGSTWTTTQPAGTSNSYNAVSCPATNTCFATTTGNTLVKTTDGSTWTAAGAVAAQNLSGISCPSTTTCFATALDLSVINGYEIYKTTDGGTNWTLSFNLGNDSQAGVKARFSGINCPSTALCYAVGDSGVIAATSDGGMNWRTDSSPSTANLTGVSCPAAGTCFVSAVDSTILHTTNFGGSWDTQQDLNPNTAISCPSTTVCFTSALHSANSTTKGGAAWTRLRPAGTTADIVFGGLSCVGFNTCYAAAGGTLMTTHDGGATWATHVLGTTDLLIGISCPSATTCYAVGWPMAIYKTTDAGTTWTLQSTSFYGSDNTLVGVSCANENTCVAVGTGPILSNASATWAAEPRGGTTGTLYGVSCPNAVSCVAVGANGLVDVRTSGSWTSYPSGTIQTLFGASCPIATQCYAVGLAGTIIRTTTRGQTWVSLSSGTTHHLFAVSCFNSANCLAGGNFGVVLSTADAATWNPVVTSNSNPILAVAYVTATHAVIAGLGGTILATAACTSATLTSDKASPQPGGTTVTFTAHATGAGCTSPLYQYWMWTAATGWVMRQAYSTNNQFILNTTGMAPGTYTVDVWAEQSGSPLGTSNYETFGLEAWVVGGCDSATLSPNPAPTTGTVMFTATAAGIGCSNPQFQFFMWSPATGWVQEQAYSSIATWTVNVDSLAGATYSVDVWVKQAGSPSTYETWALSSIPKGACGPTTVTATQSSPQSVGTTINLAAVNTGCTVPNYRYWDYPSQAGVGPNAMWSMLRDYSALGTYNWITTNYKPGTQSIVVHVRAATSTAAYDTDGMVAFSLTGCSTASVSASPAPPQAAGTTVMLTASVVGCPTPLYQFQYYLPGTGWVIAQDWSATATYSWNTSGLPPGTYAWVVFVKQQGSANDHDTYALFNDTAG